MLAVGSSPLRAQEAVPETPPAVVPAGLPPTVTAPPVAAPAPAPATVVPTTPSPGALGPDVFFLPDANGNLRRVLGYRYEDFFQSWRAAQSQQDEVRQPEFALLDLSANATAEEDFVAIDLRIEVEIQSSNWVEVPLQLGALIIDNWKSGGKDSRDFILFDPVRQSYVAWIQGKPGDRREIELTGKLIVQRDGDSRQLEVELPAAATSHVDFTSSGEVEIEAPKLAIHSTVTADDGRYTSQIEGAKGRLALRWGPRVVEQFDRAATLSAGVDATATIDPGRITYEAVVALRSFGEPLDRVRIRLPRGAAAASLPAGAGYELIPIASTSGRNGSSLVEVRFDQPSATPPPVRLVAEQTGGADAAAPMTATPFEVVGAFRQRNQLVIRVNELLHADFHGEGRIEQIDPLELPENLRTPAPLAAFSGAGADWELAISTQPRQRKVRVTPTYAMNLGSHGATLDVTLDYQFLGGRTFELRADLRGWELTEQPIESGGVVDLIEQHVTPAGVLVLPLKESDLQQTRVRFTLRREAGLGLHDLPLPQLLEAYTLPGVLSVSCDDAWRATVQVENSSGITSAESNGPTNGTANGVANGAAATPASAIAATPALDVPATPPSRRDAAARRFQIFLERPRVAIDVSEREQSIAVDSTVDGKLADGRLEVEQRLRYDIAFQPASELTATIPAALSSNSAFQLLLDGQPLPATAFEIQPLSATATATELSRRLVVRLPRATVGRTVLQLRSAYAIDESQQTGRAKITLPLAIPALPAATRANIASAAGQARVALWSDAETEPWRSIAPDSTGVGIDQQPTLLQASAAKPVGELSLRLEPALGDAPAEVRCDATWVQTWVVGGQRQDRFVYRFRTSAPQVELVLPEDFEGRPLEAVLDGQVIPADRSGARLTVVLPQGDGLQTHTLELRRHAPQRIAATTGLSASFPMMENVQGTRPFFWQLIVPRDMSVVTTPAGMNGEYKLGWREWSWGRQPTQGQDQLEEWTNATSAPELPASTNEYLYSAFDSPAAADVQLVRRAWLIIAAGAGALAVGLVALYTNLGRTAGFWLAAMIAAVASLAAYPEAAVMLVQAIFLGGAFTIVSLLTRWLLADVRIRRSAPPAPPSSVASLTATQPWLGERPDDSIVATTSGSTRQVSGTSP
ncbi:hypothetical protein PLANPX_0897 [Lacipirellula parvula]|uniref:Uncharacterized protein n=1 Tax=Lacipirellula parvula TaxID=2650471 RepID=A0A5K7X4H4_9BACT|nr:hypothetical protein PLANPX_0897 [Lacipirellula parvula]